MKHTTADISPDTFQNRTWNYACGNSALSSIVYTCLKSEVLLNVKGEKNNQCLSVYITEPWFVVKGNAYAIQC